MASQKQPRIVVPTAYKKLMPFNRFAVESVDNILITHFGLVNNTGVLLDRYSCAIFKLDLEGQKESLMQYLGQLGALGDAPPQWQPPSASFPIDMANHIGLTSNPAVAETTLNNIVIRALIELKGAGGTIHADGIALLRSTQEVQKHWIKDLYPA